MTKIIKILAISLTIVLTQVLIISPALAQNPIGPVNIPSNTVPNAADPNAFVGNFVKTLIRLILIVGFIISFIFFIIAGMQFLFAGGDPKNVSTAWSRIYWGIIGLVVVLASFAIIRMVETFFAVNIISGTITIPTI